jgi:hypothetical protein
MSLNRWQNTKFRHTPYELRVNRADKNNRKKLELSSNSSSISAILPSLFGLIIYLPLHATHHNQTWSTHPWENCGCVCNRYLVQQLMKHASTSFLACLMGAFHEAVYTRIQLVTNLQQTCTTVVSTTCHQLVIRMCSHCLFLACWEVVNSLLYKVIDSTDLLQVVPTTSNRPAIQQLYNKLWVTTLQLVRKLTTGLLQTYLVDKIVTCVV